MKIEDKYSGKIRKFEKELDRKFGLDEEEETEKGVAQLANHIGRLFRERVSERSHIDELDCVLQNSHSRVEKITPVLIVQEPILRFHIIEEMLSRRFLRLLARKKVSKGVRVAPLAVIDIDTLERMRPNLVAGDFTLEQCLNARAARDPDYKQFFHSFLSDNFSQYGKREDLEISSKFKALMNRAAKNFFGGDHHVGSEDEKLEE